MSALTYKVRREFDKCAVKAGVILTSVVQGTRHTKLYVEREGRCGLVVAAGDSKDWRALRNTVTQMRKAVR